MPGDYFGKYAVSDLSAFPLSLVPCRCHRFMGTGKSIGRFGDKIRFFFTCVISSDSLVAFLCFRFDSMQYFTVFSANFHCGF